MMFAALIALVIAVAVFAVEAFRAWPVINWTAVGLGLFSLGVTLWVLELLKLKMLPLGL